MALPYDATLKDLLETNPVDWLSLLGLPTQGPIGLIDADLSTVSTQADKVFLIDGPVPWILHLEFQSSPDTALPRRLYRYNALLLERHGAVAHSVVVLLRRAADLACLTGELRMVPPGGPESIFRYTVVRLWQMPIEGLIDGGLSTLPLAPLADVSAVALPGLIRRMGERLIGEAAPEQAAKLWTATYVLMGLRYDREMIDRLLQGVRAMEESVTYQAIIEKGQAKGKAEGIVLGERSLLLRQARKRFGAPTAEELAALEAITDPERLGRLGDRLLEVNSWKELLATP